MKLRFKYLIVVFLLIFLSSCAGADRPYVVGGDPGTPDPGKSKPPGGDSGISKEGCAIKFNGKLVIRTKLNPGEPDTDANGVLNSEPKPLPEIIFHFNGNQVTLFGDEFETAKFILGSTPVEIQQKAGTKASGSYDATAGSLTINGLQFAMLKPLQKDFPPFNFTTGDSGEIPGAKGALNETGKALAEDGSLELVGGFKIPDGVGEYSGDALSVRFVGKFERVPNPAECVGGAGAGVAFKEIVKDKDGKDQEIALGAGGLSMGSVFVSEKGIDPENASTPSFKKVKVLRIQNNTSAAVSGNFINTAQFSFSPTNVNIDPDKSQDVTVTFSTASKAYVPNDPPNTQEVNTVLSVADSSIKVAGLLKRAGPELTIEGGESNAPALVDFGIVPVKMNGSGAASQLSCFPDAPSVLGRAIKVKNTGVRPLMISQLPVPVQDDLSDTKSDPFCPSFGPGKFQRIALETSGANASCDSIVKNGHKYILDKCTVQPGDSYVQFKVVYMPKNAKSFINNSKDTAKMSILSNDPVYKEKPFSFDLQASVSKDTSDLVGISKVKNDVIQPFVVRHKERMSINVDDINAENMIQVFAIKNSSTDTLGNINVSFSDQEDKDNFKLCKVGNDLKADLASCAFVNESLISQIPPMVDKKEGIAYFAIQFKNSKKGMLSGPYLQSLTLKYVPSSTKGAVNEFNAKVIGTVGYKPLAGNVQMEVEYLGSFVDYAQLPNPRDSVDFRKYKHVKSGPLRMVLSPKQETKEGGEEAVNASDALMDVTVIPPFDQVNFATMGLSDRAKMIRLPSNSIMTCASGVDCSNDEIFNTCQDPAGPLPATYPEDQNYCSYFYYILKNGAFKGTYNNETGELTLPGADLNLYNPFHSGKALSSYPGNYNTKTSLKVTFTTSMINKGFANNIDYIPAGVDRVTNVGISPNFTNNWTGEGFDCPSNWNPAKDYDPQNEGSSPKPKFKCYLSERSSSSSPAFVKGLPAVPAAQGQRSIALVAVTRFNDKAGDPEYIPFFMNNQTMWIVFQGRLKQCKDDWSDCSN